MEQKWSLPPLSFTSSHFLHSVRPFDMGARNPSVFLLLFNCILNNLFRPTMRTLESTPLSSQYSQIWNWKGQLIFDLCSDMPGPDDFADETVVKLDQVVATATATWDPSKSNDDVIYSIPTVFRYIMKSDQRKDTERGVDFYDVMRRSDRAAFR